MTRNEKIWAHSGDSHFIEPDDLWTQILPRDLAARMPWTELVEDGRMERIHVDGEIYHFPVPKIAQKRDDGRLSIVELSGRPPGARDLHARLADLDREGIWGEVVYSSIGKAAWMWNAEMKLDSTGAGDVVLGELQNRSYCPEHNMTMHPGAGCSGPDGRPLSHVAGDEHEYHRIDCTGYEFTSRSKVQLVTHLAQVLGHGYDDDDPDREFGRIVAPAIGRLRVQLGGYMWDDGKLDTDEVMALALAAWAGVRDLPGAIAAGAVH